MKVAVVDDNAADRRTLQEYIGRYAAENELKAELYSYADGLDFLDDLKRNFDIVFLDVEMPHLDGIQTAARMRESDETAVLVFITNLAQYAIHGYEVNAIEFMVKPVGYYNFSDKMEKAIKFMHRNAEKVMLLKQDDIVTKLRLSEIFYLEKDKNYVIFHTERGDFRERGAMTEMEKKLEGTGFSKCISGRLVNLRHVAKLEKDLVWVGQAALPLARAQKKQFAQDLVAFLGGDLV